jgi:hypothetical protein
MRIVTGDLNAKVGIESEGLEHVMGRHRINENGDMFIISVHVKDLLFGGTLFIRKEIHKNTWVSPDLRIEIQMDSIAISWSIRRSLIDVRTIRGADIGSDHHLVVAFFE